MVLGRFSKGARPYRDLAFTTVSGPAAIADSSIEIGPTVFFSYEARI
jgi:hypothetical protein